MTTGWTGDRAIISLLQPLSEATLLEGIQKLGQWYSPVVLDVNKFPF